jgi:hypothetical protein
LGDVALGDDALGAVFGGVGGGVISAGGVGVGVEVVEVGIDDSTAAFCLCER